MKIKDILGEDDQMKIKSVSGKDVTLDQGGTEIKTTTDALVPSADKPGEFTMKPMDPNQMKTGATVTPSTSTSEEIEDEMQGDVVKKVVKHHGEPVGEIGIDPEASPGNGEWYVKHYASGHDTVGFDSAEEALAELRHIVKHGMEENQDLIAQGNQYIGGDPTDEFIKDVETKPHMPGSYQAEDNELLNKMLTIAGLR
jgi:hypothetical protein